MNDKGGDEITPMMSIRGPGGIFNQPIHESLTLAALINGNFGVAQDTTVDNASNHNWEYIRGAVWNDDPDCLLFNDDVENNHAYSTGAMWAYKFKTGETQWKNLDSGRFRNPTGRSHYGDLKFLHYPLKFKPGTTDDWGAIENFHTYGGQNGNAHSHYDHSDDKLPDSGNLGNLAQFDGLIGCRVAIEKCKALLTLKQAGKKWDDGVREYLDGDVFALSPKATPANSNVW